MWDPCYVLQTVCHWEETEKTETEHEKSWQEETQLDPRYRSHDSHEHFGSLKKGGQKMPTNSSAIDTNSHRPTNPPDGDLEEQPAMEVATGRRPQWRAGDDPWR